MVFPDTREPARDQLVSVATQSMQWLLRESPRRASDLAKDWIQHRRSSKSLWQGVASATVAESLARAEAISIPDLDRLSRFVAEKSNGLILTTLHMGDYLHSCLAIIRRMPGRKIIIVRRKPENELDRKVFGKLARLGIDYEIARLDQAAGSKVFRCLRRGGIAVMLFDLPARFGTTSPITLAGRQMFWVTGPVRQAAITDSYLIPFVSHYGPDGCSACDLLTVSRVPREAFVIESHVQSLARQAEGFIRTRPEQWLHWHLVPEMLCEQPLSHAFSGETAAQW